MNLYERAQILEIVKQCDRDAQRILEMRVQWAQAFGQEALEELMRHV